ncbi:hypothetical protein EDB89DRAFT_1516671 [Lactarius sanguifluus]|nr:hypothetical protein EDB89DRAFT_1516671 [Lactarius sanguifluus]
MCASKGRRVTYYYCNTAQTTIATSSWLLAPLLVSSSAPPSPGSNKERLAEDSESKRPIRLLRGPYAQDRATPAGSRMASLYVRNSNRRSGAPARASGAPGDAPEGGVLTECDCTLNACRCRYAIWTDHVFASRAARGTTCRASRSAPRRASTGACASTPARGMQAGIAEADAQAGERVHVEATLAAAGSLQQTGLMVDRPWEERLGGYRTST